MTLFGEDDETPFVLQIKGGTTKGQTNLCKTCRESMITRDRNNHEVTLCLYSRVRQITAPIAECNKYDNMSMPSLYDLKQIAWSVETDKKSSKIGFYSPEEQRKRDRRRDE